MALKKMSFSLEGFFFFLNMSMLLQTRFSQFVVLSIHWIVFLTHFCFLDSLIVSLLFVLQLFLLILPLLTALISLLCYFSILWFHAILFEFVFFCYSKVITHTIPFLFLSYFLFHPLVLNSHLLSISILFSFNPFSSFIYSNNNFPLAI